MTTGFEQAGIKIEKQAEFAALKQSIERLLSAALIDKFFKKIQKSDIRIREFEAVLSKRLMEQADENLAKSGQSAQALPVARPTVPQASSRRCATRSPRRARTTPTPPAMIVPISLMGHSGTFPIKMQTVPPRCKSSDNSTVANS